MKTIFRSFGLGAVLTALFAVGGINAFAQDNCGDVDAINAAYQEIIGTYKATDLPTFKKAIDNGKAFLEKYGTCEVAKDNVTWVKNNVPKWETRYKEQEGREARSAVLSKFDDAIKTKNWDAAYAAADEFNSKFPNDDARINLIVPLGWIGFQQVGAKDNKYNAKAIANAKAALEILKAGNVKPKTSGGYGAFQFECASREECISFLTYTIGYVTYYGDGNKQAAVPYYYEASKLPGSFKTNPVVYGTIGDYYYETVKKMAEEVKAKIADQKDTDTDEVKAKKDADIKQAVGLLNGYAERAMDAYSRAYTLAKADPKTKAYSDSVYKQIQALYTVRFQKQDGIDNWIATTVAKPFPDPTSTVSPVGDETTTTNTTGATTTPSSTSNTAATKPAVNPIKPRQ